jgi:hypothetical protein
MFPMVLKNRQLEFELGAKNKPRTNSKPRTKKPAKQPKRIIDTISSHGYTPTTASSRVVNITGQCKPNQSDLLMPQTSDLGGRVKNFMTQQGWNVSSSQFVWKPELGVYWFRIVATVDGQYSERNVIDNATTVLQSVTTNNTVGFKAFTDIQVFVELDTKTQITGNYTEQKPSGGNSNSTKSPSVNVADNSLLNSLGLPDKDDFFTSLGTSLGVTTPIVILVAAGIALVVLRK